VARGSRLSLCALVALIVTFLTVPVAHAGLIGTGPASYCDNSATQPFLGIDGDSSYYVLMPGGSFESGPGWTLSGGAKVVFGNESFFVHGGRDSRSLYLPAGSSATTPTMCFKPGDWHLRVFSKSSGSTSGLRVTVQVRSVLGLLSVLDGGTVSPSGAWQPSKQLNLTLTNLGNLLGTTCAIAIRFAPAGSGSFQLDDAYLDPWVGT